MTQDRSKAGLTDFLNWLGDKGHVPANTAVARKIVAAKVLADLSDEEATDVTKLDLDSIMARFKDRNPGKYGADSLRTYHSRLRNSIQDFARYADDPVSFRPRKSSGTIARPKLKLSKRAPTAASAENEYSPDVAEISISAVNAFPILLRENVTVKIIGLPFDLSSLEAKKIANIVLAHVSE